VIFMFDLGYEVKNFRSQEKGKRMEEKRGRKRGETFLFNSSLGWLSNIQ